MQQRAASIGKTGHLSRFEIAALPGALLCGFNLACVLNVTSKHAQQEAAEA